MHKKGRRIRKEAKEGGYETEEYMWRRQALCHGRSRVAVRLALHQSGNDEHIDIVGEVKPHPTPRSPPVLICLNLG